MNTTDFNCEECMEGSPYRYCCRIECGEHEFCRNCTYTLNCNCSIEPKMHLIEKRRMINVNYKEEKRDLFSVPDKYYLVQCISADFAMGAGIAVQFNKHFNTKENLKNKYGDMLCEWKRSWNKGFCIKDGRVFNLITKERYYYKPTEETIQNALARLREQAQEQDIRYLAMPRIGSGLDKMPWKVVRSIIAEVFDGSNIEILVCNI